MSAADRHQLADLLGRAARARRRLVVLLAGPRPWGLATLAALPRPAGGRDLWFSDRRPPGVAPDAPAGHCAGVLGREYDRLIYDAHAGFDPDAFGAACGTLVAGGMLCLLVPPLAAWPGFPDPQRVRIQVWPEGPEAVGGRFLGRLARILARAPDLVRITPAGIHWPTPPAAMDGAADSEAPPEAPTPLDPLCRTPDQAAAVAALVHLARGHRHRPLVLTSDRGRGKSAAFGIAAARLLAEGVSPILVTAPAFTAVETLFERAREALPQAERLGHELHLGAHRLRFLAPDELLAERPAARLLLVDEAAAIPTGLLTAMLTHWSRIAFATTVHGYEGTGRGFAIRFQAVLDRRTPHWRALRLETPIRWARGDPLEALVFRLLLLDAGVADAVPPGPCAITRLDRDRLARDDATLGPLFGLLVQAHYRTRPLDLRHLLDGPNLEVWVARRQGAIAGVLLAAREGGFDPATCRAVWEGRRRPHGHMLPETLVAHLGLVAAGRARGWRVVRLAVHPDARRQGIGSALIAALARHARDAGGDYLGTGFGLDAGLVPFWRTNGFHPLRLGVQRGSSTGAHALVMLRPLGLAGERLLGAAQARYLRHLRWQLAGPLRDLDGAGLGALVPAREAVSPTPADREDLEALARHRRLPEAAAGAVATLAWQALLDPTRWARLEDEERVVLVGWALQHLGWGELAARTGLAGRREVVAVLRRAVGRLLD